MAMITSSQSYVLTNSCQTHQTERQSRNQTCWHRFSINVNTTTLFITDVKKGKLSQFLSRSHYQDDLSSDVPNKSRAFFYPQESFLYTIGRKTGPQQSTGMRRIRTFRSTKDRIYDGGPIRLYYNIYNIIPLPYNCLQYSVL